MLDGDVTFYVGEETYRAGTGTFVFLPHGVPHFYTFETDVVRMLCIIRAWRVGSALPACSFQRAGLDSDAAIGRR